MVIREPPSIRRPASPSTLGTATLNPPPAHHKGCNSATCCSPAKIWRNLQNLIKDDDPEALIKHFKQADEQRLQHIVRVALTARLTNDASLYPPSQQHKLVRLTTREATVCFGKSFTDLNSLQLALMTSSEETVLALLTQLKSNIADSSAKGNAEKWSSFINHIWGQGNTTLHLAAHLGRRQVVKQLLDLGCCKVRVRNARNKYAEDCCVSDQRIISNILAYHKSNNTTTRDAVSQAKPSNDVRNKKETVDQATKTMKMALPIRETSPDDTPLFQHEQQQPCQSVSTVPKIADEPKINHQQTKQQVTVSVQTQLSQQHPEFNQSKHESKLSAKVTATTIADTGPKSIHGAAKQLPLSSLCPTVIKVLNANKITATTFHNGFSSIQQNLKPDKLRTNDGRDSSNLDLTTPYRLMTLLDDHRRCIAFYDQQEQLKKPPDRIALQQNRHCAYPVLVDYQHHVLKHNNQYDGFAIAMC